MVRRPFHDPFCKRWREPDEGIWETPTLECRGVKVHGFFVLMVVMPLMPGLHPRMATEQRGPEPTRQLEPPGFLAMNYGRRTPVSVIFAHLVYGAVLGAFYRLR